MVIILMVLLKLADWLLYQFLANSCYRAAVKVKNYSFFSKNPSPKSPSPQNPITLFPNLNKHDHRAKNRASDTIVCDIDGSLLKSSHFFFPYFMLVAFEGGSVIRAFLLLLSYPILLILDRELKLKAMIFIAFFGLKSKDMDCVSRAVLPKFYMENLNLQVYELLARCGKSVVFTGVPRVMVEGFLKEYLGVDHVVGTELQSFGSYFTGFVSGSSGLVMKHRALKMFFGDEKPDIGIGSNSCLNGDDHLFISLCKEGYVVNDNKNSSKTPREKYPKPIIFHDGRLAFLPTPFSTLSMFLWLPFGIFIAIFRLTIGIYLPYKIAIVLGSLSGVNIKAKGIDPLPNPTTPKKHVLYVCTHRTLLDPVFLSTSLRRPLTAVTYSLSKMSEIIAPIKTVRLTRDRTKDSETMQNLLSQGDLVVCPEGTTCREPYLLRFSALFAELADEIVPVAMDTRVSMFYGTTASGFKWLDPVFFLMNPRPRYDIHVLGKVPRELTCVGGKSSWEVANYIQRQLGDVLGFECTTLTRRDKYLMLAGNEGVVGPR